MALVDSPADRPNDDATRSFDLSDFRDRTGIAEPGADLHAMATRMYPFCRSITGDGVRQTLGVVAERLDLAITEVPSGTQVLDWTVPREWNVRDAYVKDSSGRRVVDFQASNLHLMGYSVPVHSVMPLAELRPHLYSLPEQPDLVPFRNSYYRDNWGFSLAHRDLEALSDGDYEVVIDSTLEDGSLTYGELTLPGQDTDEVIICAHVDHPSLANDNLSGIAVATFVADYLSRRPHRLTYRILFLPVTIGAITWLARNQDDLGKVRAGLVLSLLGDSHRSTYKRSRSGTALIDIAMTHVLSHSGAPYDVQDFVPTGYDERQFNSPGFDLPMGCLMRSPWGTYPEYHNSGDDLDFIQADSLEDSLGKILTVLDVLEKNATYLNLFPKGEPQLGRRGVYQGLAERSAGDGRTELALLWVLNQSDGTHSLLDIAERSGLPFSTVRVAADTLHGLGLVALTGQ